MKKNIIRAYFDAETMNSADTINVNIITLLNKYGCNVTQTVIGVDFSYSLNQGRKAANNIYNSKITEISNSDICVFEMSKISATLVFEIFEALNQKKPVLVLQNGVNNVSQDVALMGNPSNLLQIEVYDEENLESKIKDFVQGAQSKIPITRFTVRLTEELGDYVNYLKVKMKCTSKNDVIVKLIEDRLQQDVDF